MKYKYLVTGGAGFIGSNLVERLLKDGHFVRIIDNLSTGNLKNIQEFLNNPNLEFIKGDICDLKLVCRIVKKMDYILHLAAIPSVPYSIKHPDETNNVNIVGTMNLLVAARKERIKKFVYSSSSAVYGNNKNSRVLPIQEHDAIDPISPYALQKFASERYCRFFSDFYHFPTIALRYFNVFGPKQNPQSQYSAAIPIFIKEILNNKPPIIYGDGEQTRDFVFVDDVVNANILATQSRFSGVAINIARQEKVSLNQLIKLIGEILEINIHPIYKKAKPGDIKHSWADIQEAKKIIGYKPMYSLEDGLKKTIEWYKKFI